MKILIFILFPLSIFSQKVLLTNMGQPYIDMSSKVGYNSFYMPRINSNPITKYSDYVYFGIFTDTHLGSGATDSFPRPPIYQYKYLKDGAVKISDMVNTFNQKDSLDFVVNCGDNTDNYKSPYNTAYYAKFNLINLQVLYDYLKYPHYNCIGNHDSDPALITKAEYIYYGKVPSLGDSSLAYYYFDITKATWNLRVIVLDGNYQNSSETTFGYPQWIPLHERNWLDSLLSTATGKCIIITHVQIGNGLIPACTYSNSSTIRGILETYGNVLCVLQGHEHNNNYELINGIPYVSLVAQSLDAYPGNGYALIKIKNNYSITITGYGIQTSYQIP